MQRITPFLWFNNQAEEAAKFYTSVFKNSKIGSLSPFISTFQLEEQNFIALNGGPQYQFTEAVSFVVNCETQDEIDYYWEKLSDGGEEGRCGWLKDKFGLSWQVVPTVMGQLMQDKNKAGRVTEALMKMKKLDIATLQQA